MAKVTYKGQDDQESITFRNQTFNKGESVEVTDPVTVAKLKSNPNFTVEGAEGPPTDPPPPWQQQPTEPGVVPAPSTVSAQYPVPKPGEPIDENRPAPEHTPAAKLKPIPKVSK